MLTANRRRTGHSGGADELIISWRLTLIILSTSEYGPLNLKADLSESRFGKRCTWVTFPPSSDLTIKRESSGTSVARSPFGQRFLFPARGFSVASCLNTSKAV